MAQAVKYFTSGMQGAPVVSNGWGDLTSMLDAVLVNGFNLKTVDSITSTGGVATATVSTGHGYVVNQVVLIAGCEQAAYNGEQVVTGVTASTFTFAVTGTPASPATTQSAISAKVAPLGFQIAFTGTNKRVYRSPNVLSTRPFLRVDNSLDPVWTTTYAKYAKVTMAENMTDIDTFVGARAPYDPNLPTKNEVGTGSGATAIGGWYKWIHSHNVGSSQNTDGGTGARNWVVVGDDRGFFIMLPRQTGHTVRSIHYFGDFASFKAGDAYPCLLTAVDDYNAANSGSSSYPSYNVEFEYTADYAGKTLMRDYTQLGNPVRAGFFTLNPSNTQMVSGRIVSVPWPNGPDFSLQLWPVWIREESGHVRGQMPGVFFIPQSLPYSDLTVVENVVNYAGRKFLLVCGAYTSDSGTTNSTRVAFDITGPWR
jgi:hypothetical protein